MRTRTPNRVQAGFTRPPSQPSRSALLRSPRSGRSFAQDDQADESGYGGATGRTRAAKFVFTAGAVQANCDGQPGSVVGFRQRASVVTLMSPAVTAPSKGCTYVL